MARFSVLETDRHVVWIHAHLYYGVSKRTFRGHIGMVASPHRYLRKENHEHIARPWLWPSLLLFFFIKDKKGLLKKDWLISSYFRVTAVFDFRFISFMYLLLHCYWRNSVHLSPEGEVNSGEYTETRNEPTLRGLVVLVFTKSVG